MSAVKSAPAAVRRPVCAAAINNWLDGGPEPATTLDDNLQSMAMLFGAVRAAETGMGVDVREVAREVGALA